MIKIFTSKNKIINFEILPWLRNVIKDEEEYKYPDPIYFTEFTRLSQNYPDKSIHLLEEFNKRLI